VQLDEEQVGRVLDHLKSAPMRHSYESADDIRALLAEVFPHGVARTARIDSVPRPHIGSGGPGHQQADSPFPAGRTVR
jgi:hypothetical protein